MRAVQVAPALYLVTLLVATYLLVPCLFPAGRAPRRPWRVFFAALGTVVAILTAPTVFDSYLWITSSVGYIGGTSFMLAGVAVFVRLMRTPGRLRPVAVAGALVLFAFAQGFNEAHSLTNVGLATLYLLWYGLARRRGHWLFAVAVWAETVALFLFMYFSPGTAKRSAQTAPEQPILTGLKGIKSGYQEVIDSFSRGDRLLILALAVFIAVLLARRGLRAAARVCLTGVGLAFVPAAAFLFTSFYATGWGAPRTYGAFSPMVAWGWAAIVGAALAAAWQGAAQIATTRRPASGRPRGLRPLAAGLGVVLLAGGAAYSMPNVLALTKAEALRAQMMDFRDDVVRLAVKKGWTQIPVFPAPVLYAPSNASDFQFATAEEQIYPWYENGYRFIFHIPDDAEFVYVTDQPAGYCTDSFATPVWTDTSSKTCAQLARAWVKANRPG
jgi:hypothetical protein